MVAPGGPFPLSGDKLQNWLASPSMQKAFNELPGAEILRQLRASGAEIRTQTFYEIRREILSLEKWEEAFSTLRPETLAPSAWMQERTRSKLTSQASYRFRVTVADMDTGDEDILTRAMATDIHYTRAEAEQAMAGLLAGPLVKYNKEILEVQIFEIWTREDPKFKRELF